MATTTRARATEADLRAQPEDGNKYELVDGEIRMSPGGTRHSAVGTRLLGRLLSFVQERRLGWVLGADAGFRLPGGNVRSPDVSFVRAGRFPDGREPDDYADLAPDLVAEVVSPGDRPRHVLDKVGEYLEAGTRLVWVIDPRKRNAGVYRSTSEVREIGAADALDGEEVLPGFTCPLREIL
jgi:Uma2 family endonuclease